MSEEKSPEHVLVHLQLLLMVIYKKRIIYLEPGDRSYLNCRN